MATRHKMRKCLVLPTSSGFAVEAFFPKIYIESLWYHSADYVESTASYVSYKSATLWGLCLYQWPQKSHFSTPSLIATKWNLRYRYVVCSRRQLTNHVPSSISSTNQREETQTHSWLLPSLMTSITDPPLLSFVGARAITSCEKWENDTTKTTVFRHLNQAFQLKYIWKVSQFKQKTQCRRLSC